MSKLTTVLEKYRDKASPVYAGGGGGRGAKAVEPEEITRLKAELRQVQESNRNYFRVCVSMILVLYLATIGVVLANLHRSDMLKVLAAVFGVSAPGLTLWMISLWREKFATETLLVLATHGDQDALKMLLNWWARRLRSFPLSLKELLRTPNHKDAVAKK